MGFFRFRRSFRVLPGVRINLGKRSASVSVGVRGAHVTMGGPSGTRTTVGLSGTGLGYTEVSGTGHAAPDAALGGSAVRGWVWLALLVVAVVALVTLMAGCTATVG